MGQTPFCIRAALSLNPLQTLLCAYFTEMNLSHIWQSWVFDKQFPLLAKPCQVPKYHVQCEKKISCCLLSLKILYLLLFLVPSDCFFGSCQPCTLENTNHSFYPLCLTALSTQRPLITCVQHQLHGEVGVYFIKATFLSPALLRGKYMFGVIEL